MPYQADFICTYKQMYDEEDQHLLYQIQLLQAFGLQSFNAQEIEEEMTELLSTLLSMSAESKLFITSVLARLQHTTDPQRKMMIELCKQSNESGVNDLLLSLLFRFECFDLFHKCLCDLFRFGSVKSQSLEELFKQCD